MDRAVIPALALLACTPPPPPDVILVTLDTVRADRLGAYGYADAHTESIDALAASGRLYERAYSPVPLTIPAHSAIMTGRYPADLGVRGNGDSPLPEDAVTLAEALKANGYVTGASVAAFVTTRAWGFAQGFDAYFDAISQQEQNLWHAERPGNVVVDDAIAWWQAQPPEKSRFLWVHLYDAHYPYAPPPDALERAKGRPYDGELAFVDDQVGRLVQMAGDRDVLWVLVGDHGEGLGDHGELTHGMFVYDATQHVPFILSGHGVRAEPIAQPVSLVDVAPTVLSLVNAQSLPAAYGRAVPASATRPIYMDAWSLRDRFGLAPHVAVIDGADLLIDLPRPELYDSVADAAEKHDRSTAEPDRVKALQATLKAFGYAAPAAEARGVADPEMAHALAALGYTDGGFTGAVDGALPDPKDHARMISQSQRAERLDMEQSYADAEALYRELIAGYPDANEFRNRLAIALEKQGKRAEAIAALREAITHDPNNVVIQSTLAALLARDGQHAEASALFISCANAMPYSKRLRHGALMSTISDGRPADAVTLGLGWLATDPDDHVSAGLVGLAYYRIEDHGHAETWLAQGAMAEVPAINVCFRLSEYAAKRGDLAAATSWLEREVAAHPENEAADDLLIPTLSKAERWTELATAGAAMTRAHPEKPLYWHAWAQARFNLKDFAGARAALDPGLALHPESSLLVLVDANLLAKEGQRERGALRFEAAKVLQAAGK